MYDFINITISCGYLCKFQSNKQLQFCEWVFVFAYIQETVFAWLLETKLLVWKEMG